jgi:hypothetical protein
MDLGFNFGTFPRRDPGDTFAGLGFSLPVRWVDRSCSTLNSRDEIRAILWFQERSRNNWR